MVDPGNADLIVGGPEYPLATLPQALNAPLPPGVDQPGFIVEDRRGLTMVELFASRDCTRSLMETLAIGNTAGRVTETRRLRALPLAPGHWLIISLIEDGAMLVDDLAFAIQGKGSISPQSNARICLRVSGTAVRTVLQKGCPLDLHPRHCGRGFVARTQIADFNAILHLTSDDQVFDIYINSSFAVSFWLWLIAAAREFGVAARISNLEHVPQV